MHISQNISTKVIVPRTPFQVLVYLHRKLNNGHFEYALMKRADDGTWQGIAGGGENGETPFEAAI